MSMLNGIQPAVSYAGVTTAGAGIDRLLALLPDPDERESPNPRNPGSILDQMSPMAAAQLRVELAALRAAVGAFEAP
jgi:hypothetical protein